MLYAVSTSDKSLSSISTFSVIKPSLNNFILLSVNSLVNGLSLILLVCISRNEKLGRWSEISTIKLPDEHLFCIHFLDVLIKIYEQSKK